MQNLFRIIRHETSCISVDAWTNEFSMNAQSVVWPEKCEKITLAGHSSWMGKLSINGWSTGWPEKQLGSLHSCMQCMELGNCLTAMEWLPHLHTGQQYEELA